MPITSIVSVTPSSQPASTSRLGVVQSVAVLLGAVAVLLVLAVVTHGILVPSAVALLALVVPSVTALRGRGDAPDADAGEDAPRGAAPVTGPAPRPVAPARADAPAAQEDAPVVVDEPTVAPFAADADAEADSDSDADFDSEAERDVVPVAAFAGADDGASAVATLASSGVGTEMPLASAAVLEAPAPAASGGFAVGHLPEPAGRAGATHDVQQRTILLVDDEDALRRFCARILERAGFAVLQARTGAEALEVAEGDGVEIDLLLTDVVMPQMSGRELAQRLVNAQAGVKIVYVSGYADDTILRHGIERDGVAFLQKPFKSGELLDAVNQVFGG